MMIEPEQKPLHPAPAESKPPQASTIASVDPARRALTERANKGDPVAAIELVRLVDAEMACKTPPGITVLRLHPRQCNVYRKVARSLAEVDAGLCNLFGQLSLGNIPWPLLIWGGIGSGKTFAGLCFADMVRGSIFLTLEQACDAVMRGERPWESKAEEHGDLLVLDEIGERSKAGDLQYTTLKSILDYREFNYRRVAIYISNLPPNELAALFDDRIVSRLTAGNVVKLAGPDRRIEK